MNDGENLHGSKQAWYDEIASAGLRMQGWPHVMKEPKSYLGIIPASRLFLGKKYTHSPGETQFCMWSASGRRISCGVLRHCEMSFKAGFSAGG